VSEQQIKNLERECIPLQRIVETASRALDEGIVGVQNLQALKARLLEQANPDLDELSRATAAVIVAERKVESLRATLREKQAPLDEKFRQIHLLREQLAVAAEAAEDQAIERKISELCSQRDAAQTRANTLQHDIDLLQLRRNSRRIAAMTGTPINPDAKPATKIAPTLTARGWVGVNEHGVTVPVPAPE
jgi:hypothetical protein